MKHLIILLSAILLYSSFNGSLCGAQTIPLDVLYLSRANDSERTTAFQKFLDARFQSCVVAQRSKFDASLLGDIDVVLLDWSQRERISNKEVSPLGPLENWSKPMVLLGSAGLHMADSWNVIGDAG